MLLVTVALPDGSRRLGLVEDDRVRDLTAIDPHTFASFTALLQAADQSGVLPAQLVAPVAQTAPPRWSYTDLDQAPSPSAPFLAMPLEPVEVWAAGVTYERSRDAREVESKGSTIYDRVYAAERPELFFKATGYRTVGPNRPVGIRSDSAWQVPEPELGLVVDSRGRILGYTIGNDMSSRDIEGENPLYLPQAKIFRHSCAIGPAVLLAAGGEGPFPITIEVVRSGESVFRGETSTARMKRGFGELVSYLARNNDVYTPTVLLTGAGIVPPDEFTLREGDEISITVPGLGTLRNPVLRLV